MENCPTQQWEGELVSGRAAAKLPAELRAHVNALVEAAHAGVSEPPGPAFDLVTSWCEVHQDDSGIQSGAYGEGFLIVPLGTPLPGCSDEEADLDESFEGMELSDEIRVVYVRDVLRELFGFETGDADLYPMGCSIRIRASDGREASLCLLRSGGGCRAEPDVQWVGVFRNSQAFRTEIRNGGELTELRDVDALGEDDLLAMWDRKDGHAP
jgi:hypothetical protein